MTYTKTGPSYWTKLIIDPHDLLARHKMSELLAYDPATTRRDQLLWDFHLGWQVEKYGHTSLASVRTIHDVLTDRSPTGKSPLSLRHIAEGNRALCDRGLLKEVEKGTGRRGSRYALNWDLLSQAAVGQPFSVSSEGCASGGDGSVSPEETAVFPTGGKLNGDSVSLCGNKDPTPYPVERPGYGVGGTNVPAGGGALHHHPDGGLTPPPGGKPPGGFEELWAAYGHRRGKAAAHKEWQRIAPSPSLADAMVACAAYWRTDWEAKGNPDAPRFTLARWLADKLWEEDPPKTRKSNPSRKPAVGAPAPPAVTAANTLDPQRVRIASADVEADVDDHIIILGLIVQSGKHAGQSFNHAIRYHSVDRWTQEQGKAELIRLCRAAGVVDRFSDTDILVGRDLVVTRHGDGSLTYGPVAANDNSAPQELEAQNAC